jgi:phosphatidylglycerol lysyltransferase
VVSVIDIVSAGACLYVLIDHPQVPFLAFLVVYALALMVGVSSHVPGGLGVFESVMLFALHDSVSPKNLAAAMLAYRVIYHLIPLVLALFVLVGRELAERASPIVEAVRYIHSWSSKLVPPLLAGLAFCNGIVLLVSTATPAVPERLKAMKAFMPLVVVEIFTISGSVIGLGLLLVARGLYHKLDGAYVITLLLCLAGSVFSLAKGIDYEEGMILLGTALVLFLCRREFYRRTVLMNSPFTAGWILSILGAVGATYWITLFSYKHVEYASELWWQFEYDAEVSRSLRAGLGVAIALFILGINRLLKRPQHGPGLSSTADLDKAEAIVRAQDNVDGNLALMGDKHLLFSDTGDAFIMYGVRGTSWIALGDPIGPALVADELAWRFRELADREGGRIAFYQTSPETWPLYLDMGLVPLKYGEEALVPLETFSLQGAKRKGLRHAMNRGEHDGLSFEILPRETVPAHMEELAAVSASWLMLKNTREKRFSLGAFDPNYVKRFAVAVARHGTRIVAFATVMSTDTKAEASIDLMRHTPEAPSSTMIFLFIKLILYFKAQGFQRFALGLAPLSGLETHPLAPVWHRFGHLIYNRGERFYNFRGLREFKDKFDPVWEPRYLATFGGINPLIVITDMATLIGGGITGVFKK